MSTLKNQSPRLSFFKYAIPSTIGMLLIAVNIIIDGIFVGHALGPVALSGVNVAFPVYSLFIALSLWVGIGASSLYSEAMGKGDTSRAQTIFTQGICLIFALTLIITLIALAAQDRLIYLMGANSEIAPFANDYLGIILIFGFVFTTENALSIFVRNDGAPKLAMMALIVTAVTNVVLNYIFLFRLSMGLKGTATALVCAAAMGALIMSTHFLNKNNNLKFNVKNWSNRLFLRIFHIGFPSFLAETGSAVFTISYNITIVRVAGTIGVAAFSMISYTHSMVLMLFIGLSSGIQPLVSYYKGAGMLKAQKEVLRYALFSAFAIGIAFMIYAQVRPESIIRLFGNFPTDVVELGKESIRYFFLAYLFMGVNFVMITYFQINGNTNFAILLTGMREIVLVVLFLVILPPFLNTIGVWLAVPLAECSIFLLIWFYSSRKKSNPIQNLQERNT